eukprot:2911432-Ditylum_brightwellii.AAC.1
MKILRNVRNWKKKTTDKFGIKIPEDTEEAQLIDERDGGSKRTTCKAAVVDYWTGNSMDITIQACT